MSFKGQKIVEDVRLQGIEQVLNSFSEQFELEGNNIRQMAICLLQRYEQCFSGYLQDPKDLLATSMFVSNTLIPDVVSLQHIEFRSFCAHSLLPIRGHVFLSYCPDQVLVSLGGVAKMIEAYAARLQMQENLTVQIQKCFSEVAKPKGVAVLTRASHECVQKHSGKYSALRLMARSFSGIFSSDVQLQSEFLNVVAGGGA